MGSFYLSSTVAEFRSNQQCIVIDVIGFSAPSVAMCGLRFRGTEIRDNISLSPIALIVDPSSSLILRACFLATTRLLIEENLYFPPITPPLTTTG